MLLLLTHAISAHQKDKWERVYTLEDATIAMNSTKVEFIEGGMARVQFRWNFSKAQPLEASSEIKYKSRVEVIEFNCDRRRYRITSATFFDARGKPVFTTEVEERDREWRGVKAGGMMERLLGPACRLIEEKRR